MLKRRKQFGAGRGKCFFAKERARRAVAIGVRCMGRSSNIWSVAIVNGWCGANAFDGARMRWIAPRVILRARPLCPAEPPRGQRSARLLRSVEPSCGRHCACLLCLTELLLFFYSFIRNIAALVPARGSSPCTPGKRLRLLHLFCCRVFFGGLFSITKGL